MKIAICPGSFDPVTKGHLDIIRRTASMFDRVIVVVMHNYHKPNSYFSAIERVELITRCVKDLDNVVVDMHDGLLAAYAQEKGAVAIVRSARRLGFRLRIPAGADKQETQSEYRDRFHNG